MDYSAYVRILCSEYILYVNYEVLFVYMTHWKQCNYCFVSGFITINTIRVPRNGADVKRKKKQSCTDILFCRFTFNMIDTIM